MAKPGRKKLKEVRQVFQIRVTKKEKATLEAVADKLMMPAGTWARWLLLLQAKEILDRKPLQ